MNEYLSIVNSKEFYLITSCVLGFIIFMCVVFLIKSYRTGLQIGMDKNVLKKAITSSATFTLLPSISILLGVVALSGSLGVPFSWLRLSVVGALQYELNVAEVSAQSYGLSGLKVNEMNMEAFVTIALVMTVCILAGNICNVFFLKKYLNKVQAKPKKEVAVDPDKPSKPGFGDYATTAMFVGLCAAFIGTYVGKAIPREGSSILPLLVSIIAAAAMAFFEYLIKTKKKAWLENFSLAGSMLFAMIMAVIIKLIF